MHFVPADKPGEETAKATKDQEDPEDEEDAAPAAAGATKAAAAATTTTPALGRRSRCLKSRGAKVQRIMWGNEERGAG